MASVFEVLTNVYFNDKKDGFFVECGANDGAGASDCFALENHGWKGINIEAQNSCYESLVRNRPNAINLNMALCDKDDCDLIFNVTSQHGNSSLEHSQKHKQELVELRKSTFVEQPVKAISWKRLMSDFNVSKVDVLNLDIEGCEKYVLENMKGCNVIPEVICIEVGYEWEPKKELLKELGYRFDFFHSNNAFCSKPTISINKENAEKYRQREFNWWDVVIYDESKDSF